MSVVTSTSDILFSLDDNDDDDSLKGSKEREEVPNVKRFDRRAESSSTGSRKVSLSSLVHPSRKRMHTVTEKSTVLKETLKELDVSVAPNPNPI